MNTTSSMAAVLSAMEFAAVAHRDQRRKDDFAAPYINHPIGLARVLAETGGVDDPVTLVAAIMHDTVEDTMVTLDQIKVVFGSEVASVVSEVSDDKSLPKHERKRLQIEHARVASTRAKLVKLADKICNVSDLLVSAPVGWDTARAAEYIMWALRVVNQVRGTNLALEQRFDHLVETAVERGLISPVDI